MTEVPEAADAVLAGFAEQLAFLERRGSGRSLHGLSGSGHQRQVGITNLGALDRLDAARKGVEVLADRQTVPDGSRGHPALMTNPVDRAHRPLLLIFLSLAEGGCGLRKLQ